jgi:hypothetical protein
MLYLALLFAASVIFVEGATELVCKSSIFLTIRSKLSALHPFIKQLLGCGYCTSVWMSTIPAGFFAFEVASSVLTMPALFILFVVVIHRLSNFVHNINDKHFDKFYDKRLSVKDVI